MISLVNHTHNHTLNHSVSTPLGSRLLHRLWQVVVEVVVEEVVVVVEEGMVEEVVVMVVGANLDDTLPGSPKVRHHSWSPILPLSNLMLEPYPRPHLQEEA